VRVFCATALLCICLAAADAQATSQNPPPAQGAFEVASVHMVSPHTVDDLQKGIGLAAWSTFPAARFFAHNVDLKVLIALSYGVDDKYILSAPDWLDTQMYSIDATVEGGRELTYEQMKPLMQSLLEQRFHLAIHRETRMSSGFALTVAKGGPKLQKAKADGQPHAYIFPNRLEAQHMDMEHFVEILTHPVGYTVVDKTGLTGDFDFNVSYAPANDPNSSLPSLFTALQEQLGLKLESQKVPVAMLVIDQVNRIPIEN
jgi:uncharacterized protein (TIGR03435 family)